MYAEQVCQRSCTGNLDSPSTGQGGILRPVSGAGRGKIFRDRKETRVRRSESSAQELRGYEIRLIDDKGRRRNLIGRMIEGRAADPHGVYCDDEGSTKVSIHLSSCWCGDGRSRLAAAAEG